MKACPGPGSRITSRLVTPPSTGVQGLGDPRNRGACPQTSAPAGLAVPTGIPTNLNLAVGSGFKPDLGWRGNRQSLGVDRPCGRVSSLRRKHAPSPPDPRLKLSGKIVTVLEFTLPLGFTFRRTPTCRLSHRRGASWRSSFASIASAALHRSAPAIPRRQCPRLT